MASRLLAASYRRFGYAPVATQFSLVLACNVLSGVSGCYLISRWTIPDVLTGFLMIMGMANVLWVTSSSASYKRVWNRWMYREVARQAMALRQERLALRMVSLAGAAVCVIGAVAALAVGAVTGAVAMTGLGSISLSNAISGYLRAAPPPEPLEARG